MSNVEPGFAKLMEMKRTMKPRHYPTHQQLASGFVNEEIWISANYSARLLQFEKDGAPVRSAYPKEGAITVVFGAIIPKKAPNKEAAYHYLNSFLDPKALGGFCEASMYAPSTTNATLPPDVKARIDFTPEQAAKLNNVDYAYQAKNIAKWLEWWNKEFKA
jgi:putative spermidine/putrescine transport system substrate-binding protein